jgi:saccharopine dehydrogenase-like NADP-dependent oxidoreductase
MTYASLLHQLTSSETSDLSESVARKINVETTSPVIQKLNWLGLFSDKTIPAGTNTYLDALCHLFEEKMQYAPGERDMLVMHHEFIAQYSNRKEKTTSTLIDYGIPHGDSSMSRAVSLPAAIATRLILEGSIKLTGVYRPTLPELYNPILDELEGFGIVMKERTSKL